MPVWATMVVAGNAAKFTTQSSSEQFNSARNVEREELKEENRLMRQCTCLQPSTLSPGTPDRNVCCGHRSTQNAGGVVSTKPDKKFRGDIEGPGRVREGRPKSAGASTATPNGVHRVYKTGDPELGLDVSKLNAFAAMQASRTLSAPSLLRPSSVPSRPCRLHRHAHAAHPPHAGDHEGDGLRRGSGR